MTVVRTGPKRTGMVESAGTWPDGSERFRCRLRLGDGTKSRRFDIPKGLNEAQAKTQAAAWQAEEDVKHGLLEPKRAGEREAAAITETPCEGETADAWFARYVRHAKEAGQTDTVTKRSRWDRWVSPRLGPKPMAAVTRDDVEDVRDALDVAILAWTKHGRAKDRVSGKTSMNVWSCLTSSFKAATNSKRRDLRVLATNPCVGVEPPGDRDSRKVRRKTFVYPREAAALLACEAVPLAWREVHALAAYTYLRPGELRVLTWADVDLEGGFVSVTKAWDYEAETVKAPKTRNGVRRVPIEPALAPLLRRMAAGQPATALVAPVMSTVADNSLGELFREHMATAGVDRDSYRAGTRTHALTNFRSWRDSGITWLAMMGLGVDRMMRRAGHDVVQTTMGYVKLAEDMTGELGVPFGPLPASLVDGESRPTVPPVGPKRRQPVEILAESKGFEPLGSLHLHLISNQAPSATRTALHGRNSRISVRMSSGHLLRGGRHGRRERRAGLAEGLARVAADHDVLSVARVVLDVDDELDGDLRFLCGSKTEIEADDRGDRGLRARHPRGEDRVGQARSVLDVEGAVVEDGPGEGRHRIGRALREVHRGGEVRRELHHVVRGDDPLEPLLRGEDEGPLDAGEVRELLVVPHRGHPGHVVDELVPWVDQQIDVVRLVVEVRQREPHRRPGVRCDMVRQPWIGRE